jgi:hypothetical protein
MLVPQAQMAPSGGPLVVTTSSPPRKRRPPKPPAQKKRKGGKGKGGAAAAPTLTNLAAAGGAAYLTGSMLDDWRAKAPVDANGDPEVDANGDPVPAPTIMGLDRTELAAAGGLYAVAKRKVKGLAAWAIIGASCAVAARRGQDSRAAKDAAADKE